VTSFKPNAPGPTRHSRVGLGGCLCGTQAPAGPGGLPGAAGGHFDEDDEEDEEDEDSNSSGSGDSDATEDMSFR